MKSFSESVSNRVRTTCFAISFRTPVIDPDVSTRMIISLGLAAACRYHGLKRASNKSGSHSPCPHLVPDTITTTLSRKKKGRSSFYLLYTRELSHKSSRAAEILPCEGRIRFVVAYKDVIQLFGPEDSVHHIPCCFCFFNIWKRIVKLFRSILMVSAA